jgi:hypothetical protein
MMPKLDWRRAKKDNPTTETAATRKAELRADRFLNAVGSNAPGKPVEKTINVTRLTKPCACGQTTEEGCAWRPSRHCGLFTEQE